MANEQNISQTNKLRSLVSIFFGRFGSYRKTKEGDVLDEFELNIDRLKKVLQEIDKKWMIVTNWIMTISNYETGENIPSLLEKGRRKGLMEAYNKKWLGFRIALDLYRLLLVDSKRFEEEKSKVVTNIIQLDPQLAKRIAGLLVEASPVQSAGLPRILAPLKQVIANEQMITAYIKTHYWDIIRQIDSIKDVKFAAEIRKIVILLSGEEVNELNRCIQDIRSWPYRVSYSISLFIERGFLYLRGGKSRHDGEAFLGFNMNFRDAELVGEIRRSPEVRRLMTYQQEIEFFNRASSAIKESVRTQGKWEGFYAFYDNLDSYIKKVREDFGNEKFAKLLEVFKEQKHEAPVDWALELSELSNTLISRVYQLVVEPAGNTLIEIFSTAINKLEQEKPRAFADLQKLIAKQDPTAKIRERFLKILAKKRRELMNELEIEELEFETLTRGIILAIPEFDTKMEQAMEMADTTEELLAESRVLDASLNWRRFILANTSSFKNDLWAIEEGNSAQALTRALAGSYNSLRASLSEVKIKSRVKDRHRKSSALFQNLTKVAEEQILPMLEKCIEHIKSKLGYYTPEFKVFLNNTDYNLQSSRNDNILPFRNQPKQFRTIQDERKVA